STLPTPRARSNGPAMWIAGAQVKARETRKSQVRARRTAHRRQPRAHALRAGSRYLADIAARAGSLGGGGAAAAERGRRARSRELSGRPIVRPPSVRG